MNSRC